MDDTSSRDLPPLPADEHVQKALNSTLFLHLTTAKQYSAHTRVLLFSISDQVKPSEISIVSTLKDPDTALKDAEKDAKDRHALSNKTLRRVGIGVGALAGGVLIGVTGGLAAPLVGAGVGSLLGIFGVGGTVAGVLATGLASSTVVCGALFGAYGARSTSKMVDRYTADVEDFEFLRVGKVNEKDIDGQALAVRICISGWLKTPDDITAPWKIFDDASGNEETYALKWVRLPFPDQILDFILNSRQEVKALEDLSNALGDLLKSNALKYVRMEIIKRTALATLMAGLSPLAILKVGQLVGKSPRSFDGE